ncbi:hypothetical protein ASG39_07240 [Rhizobium sp. Leaf371]|uniref:hypothetical protein n=1 Tax=unclassified Rhizobium TaxID=2613769 RepID=UPI000712D668|nr:MULTISPECIES: hypothetical protein [unclassified Rhizobium]KQS65062.1 hypothetical protein ASG39_07240 [Rhizobium sp. Leaf371]TCM55933.1 hypothetical protein C8J36_103300 [Rhizobium sp. PP-F2F-G48]
MQKHIVEISGEAVGTLMPHARGLRFMAVKFHVWPLDGEVYADPATAHQAVCDHIAATRKAMAERMH